MNNSDDTILKDTQDDLKRTLVGYFSLLIIVLGVVGNTISFIVFRFHPSFKTMPSMVYLSFVAVTDTIALFEWNLNHFTFIIYQFDITKVNVLTCRLSDFFQFSSMQISALALSAMCVDRYVTVMTIPGSLLSKLPFRTVKTAFFWCSGIIIFCVLFNGHLLFTVGN